MAQIPLGVGAYQRTYGDLPEIRMENRFFEQNPVGAEGVALLTRPAVSNFAQIGTGPIRALYSQPGVFGGDLFVVSGSKLFRRSEAGTMLEIVGSVGGLGFPSLTGVSIPGWSAVFITDGVSLFVYQGPQPARSRLSTDYPKVLSDEDGNGRLLGVTYAIGGVHYWIVADETLVNNGSPAGTAAEPYRVALRITGDGWEGSELDVYRRLHDAINGSGEPGVDYSSALTAHPTVHAIDFGERFVEIEARTPGAATNNITTTRVTDSPFGHIPPEWPATTLQGGFDHILQTVDVPDGGQISHVATLAGFILCSVKGTQRFYWIRPGETEIDPLDFSSAESEPDEILHLMAAGGQVWIFGQSSTEVWYASGDADQPFLPIQGRAFSQGVMPGTVARAQDAIIVVGQDRNVYRITGSPERISNHGIEEMLRRMETFPPRNAWTFTLDGHAFYVLNQLDGRSMVYDLTTGQWHRWRTADWPEWNAYRGTMWNGRAYAADANSAQLRTLDPTAALDQGSHPIRRFVTGFQPLRGRHSARQGSLRLNARQLSSGQATVTMRFSDDGGKSWSRDFTATVDPGARIEFRSLGRLRAPGRLWEIEDTGPLVCIEGMDSDLEGQG